MKHFLDDNFGMSSLGKFQGDAQLEILPKALDFLDLLFRNAKVHGWATSNELVGYVWDMVEAHAVITTKKKTKDVGL